MTGGTIRSRIDRVMRADPAFVDFLAGRLDRAAYLDELRSREAALMGAGLNEDQIHLSTRFPIDEEGLVDRILEDLVARGAIPSARYPKDRFVEFRSLIDHEYDHGAYETYIFPEEARLMFALAWITGPRRTAFLGSYYGYWGVWALPGIERAGGEAWFVDLDPRVNEVAACNLRRFGFDRVRVVTQDAVEFASRFGERLDLVGLDAEGPPDHPEPSYRGKAVYHPVLGALDGRLSPRALLVCHNMLLDDVAVDPYFEAKAAKYAGEYSAFLPLAARVFDVCVEYPTTEGVGVYARVREPSADGGA